MQTLVAYDIGDTRVRNRIERICRDAGMRRAQFSAFLGECDEERRARLLERLALVVEKHALNENEEQRAQKLVVQVFPICAADFAKSAVISRDSIQAVQAVEQPTVLVV